MVEYEVPWNLENSPAVSASWVDPKEPMPLRTIRDVLEKKNASISQNLSVAVSEDIC